MAFKVIVAVCATAALAGARASRRPRAVRIMATLLSALLLFPHAVMVWCPETAGKATWLHAQHEGLTWTGGDTWTSGENKNIGWKDRVSVADMLEEVGVMRTPALSPGTVPFASVHDLLDWLGYSNSFCFFVRGGWGFALAGSVLLLIALCRGAHGPDRRSILDASRSGGAALAVAIAICLLPAALCALQIERARVAAERGSLALSLRRLELASKLLPVTTQNSDLVDQIGLLQARLGMQTSEASLYRAKTLERLGHLDEAEVLFASILSSAGPPGPVRREASRALLRRGIRELNSGEAKSALETLEAVLGADPCNVKANYALQMAYLRLMRFDSVGPLAARMRRVYRFFNTLTKLPVLAATEENVAFAAYLAGDSVAAHSAWTKLSDPKLLRTEP
jgi:hypothetical protein